MGDIAYFYSLDKVTFAVTKDGKAHVVDLPLSKLEEQLDGRVFFRVNRLAFDSNVLAFEVKRKDVSDKMYLCLV